MYLVHFKNNFCKFPIFMLFVFFLLYFHIVFFFKLHFTVFTNENKILKVKEPSDSVGLISDVYRSMN